jgi:penicillin-binding protein 1C
LSKKALIYNHVLNQNQIALPTISAALRRIIRSVPFLTCAGAAFLFSIADLLFPFRPSISYSTQITAIDGTLLSCFLSRDDKWRFYTKIEEITPLLRKTLLHKEDRYFYYHPGFNPFAIARAGAKNLIRGKRTSGASTITMQVVRLIEPRRRTYTSKLVEIFRAIQLEIHLSKDEILQLYLNLVPYGGNIEGIKTASQFYFNKPPQLLSLAEITALAIVPNRPSSLQPGKKNTTLIRERNKWLQRFRHENLFDKRIVEDAISEPLSAIRAAPPKLAPHLALRLARQYPNQPIIASTLDLQKQTLTENLVSNYVKRLKTLSINNAAVLVINNHTMEVEAYVGSADFNNPFDGGQVDGIRAVRSPGSTLKPLLYATAFDKGIITPKSILNDVPTNFAGYEPENFDQRFNGPVSAEFALANSLNIPAVKILKEVGTAAFIEQLKKAKFKTIQKQEKDLGLSLILGGCGVTLEELTTTFTTFARGGNLKSIRYIDPGDPKQKTTTTDTSGGNFISADAAFLITEVLTQVTRPDLPTNFDQTFRLPRIAWKTGTSYGKRDAWSVGYNKNYTIGVWVGNFSGAGVPELSGANIATPLLFSIFNALDYNAPRTANKLTANLALRKICPVSGQPPADYCDNVITDYYIMGVSSYKPCQHLRWIYTNPANSISYCTYCLPERGAVKKAYLNLDPELIAFYELKKIPYSKIPPHNPACEQIFNGGPPVITSPNNGSEYYLQRSEGQQMQLSCQASNDVQEIYWYVNDKLVHKSAPEIPVFITPPTGRVKISCSDDKGRNTDCHIVVKQL